MRCLYQHKGGETNMRKCKISYTGLKAADLNEFCNGVITCLTGNANFPALPTSIANMTLMNDALTTAINEAVTKDRQKLAVVRQKKAEVVTMLRGTASYVNTVSNGDEALLLCSGLELNKAPQAQGLPDQVVNLKALYTNNSGKINLRWDRAKFAKFYNVFMSADGGQTWSMLQTAFTRRLLCEALTSGSRYSFKVVSVNEKGTAQDSDIASQLAA